MNLFFCFNCIKEKIIPSECNLNKIKLLEIIDIIEYQYNDSRFNIYSLSDKIGSTRKNLWDYIYSHIKIPLFYLVENKRIENALSLFSENNYSLSEIAYSSGFNPINMRNVFKRRFGASPTEFREQILRNEKKEEIIQSIILEIWNTEHYRYKTKLKAISLEKILNNLTR